ncbi:MAG: DUF5362 domain-containing protein [Bacteroidales bacterium]|nr:DUF5362 domain-containing protein [Bacteroidales bacterium]
METENYNHDEKLVKEISSPLFASKGWIKFLAILMIVYGALTALSIIGILIAWLPVWLGVLLNKTANKIGMAQYSGNKQDLLEAQKSLAAYFTIYGVVALIGIVFAILFVVIAVSTGFLASLQEIGSEYY